MKNSWWPSRTVSTPVNLARFFWTRKNFAQIWKSPNIPCRRGHRSYAIEQRIWIRSTVKDQIKFFNRSSPLDTSNCGRTTTVDTCPVIIRPWLVNFTSDLFISQRPSSSSSGCDQSTLYNSSPSEEEVSRWTQSCPTRQWTTTSSTSHGNLLSNIVDEFSEQSSQSAPSNRRSNLGNIYLVNENASLFCTANPSKSPTVS